MLAEARQQAKPQQVAGSARWAAVVLLVRRSVVGHHRTVIVRECTAEVHVGQQAAFVAFLRDAVALFPGLHEGLLDHEVLVGDDGLTVVYLSRWRDEAAVAAFSGPGWRSDPVLLPEEAQYLARPLRVRHFTPAPPVTSAPPSAL